MEQVQTMPARRTTVTGSTAADRDGPASGPGAAVKPKQTKSRNGCATCKMKRLKCDETKPTCQQCRRRNVQCGGYRRDFKWRSFGEASFVNKPTVLNTKRNARTGKSPSPDRSKPSKVASEKSAQEAKSESLEKPLLTPQNATGTEERAQNGRLPVDEGPKQSFAEGRSWHLPIDEHEHGFSRSLDDHFPFHIFETDLTSKSYPQASNSPLGAVPIDLDIDTFTSPKMGWEPPTSHSMPSPMSEMLSPFSRPVPLEPSLGPESTEMLVTRFNKQTCGILSVKDGQYENPWRTIVWPLATDCPALYHAICSLSAFHCTKEIPRMRAIGVEHMRHSIRILAIGLRNMRTDAALATTLALVFAESWDRHVSAGTQHLRGARFLMNQTMMRQARGPLRPEEMKRICFLYNTWVYVDVVARLISLDEGSMEDIPVPPAVSSAVFHEVDPLMGCATTLFPLISRVANLVRRVRKIESNSIAIISDAIELRHQIEMWEPPRYLHPPEDPTSLIQHSVQTAQAYRWATLLYLHQAVPEIPSEGAADLAKRVLVPLATVPLSSRTTVVHIFPLFVASCEVTSEEDRNWVRARWDAMQARLSIGNIDRCIEVIREVWERRDMLERYMRASTPTGCSSGPLHPIPLTSMQTGRRASFPRSEDEFLFGPVVDLPEATDADLFGGFLNHTSDLDLQLSLAPPSPALSMATPMIAAGGTPDPWFTPDRLADGADVLGLGSVEQEKMVRGRLHWIGVMRDWGWEVLLG